MRTRNIHIQLWLNEKEAESLNKRAKQSGYSREAYIRSLLKGHAPQPKPPIAYHDMMRELRGIGNNLNQIAKKAHVINAIDVKRYDENVAMLNTAVINILSAAMLPHKIE